MKTERTNRPPTLKSRLDSIVRYANENDAWEPITPETVRRAKRLLDHFLASTVILGSDGEGGLCFEWYAGAWSFSLSERADGSSSVLLAWGSNIENEMDFAENPTDEKMARLWERFLAGSSYDN